MEGSTTDQKFLLALAQIMEGIPPELDQIQMLCAVLLVEKCGGGDVIDRCCLHYDAGFSIRKIASLYDMHVSQVWRQIDRARTVLEGHGVLPSHWPTSDPVESPEA